jgi:thermitase
LIKRVLASLISLFLLVGTVNGATVPNDPYWPSQEATSFEQVHLEEAWNISTGPTPIKIAVLDTGVSDHPDLAGKILEGYDFYANDTIPEDISGHGTMMIGIIAAATNNGIGIATPCWTCLIIPVKIGNPSGTISMLAQGIIWAVDHGAKIINISLIHSGTTSAEIAAIEYAKNNGVLVIAAAGNQGCVCTYYPAGYDYVIAVGAVDREDVHRSYSNTGPHLDLSAPGVAWGPNLKFTTGYAASSGTSASSAIVSGIAALLWSANPTYTATQIRDLLFDYAADLGESGKDSVYGWGRIDAYNSITGTVVPTPTPSPTSTPTPTVTPTPTPTVIPTPVVTPTPTITPSPTLTCNKHGRGCH